MAETAGKIDLTRVTNAFKKVAETESLIPDSRIVVEGLDISVVVNKRLMSLNLVDNRGFEADTFCMDIDDSDGLVNIPPKGARVQVWLGFKSEGLRDMGEYIIDNIEHSGTPDKLTISGNSADFSKTFLEKKSKGHHGTTIKSIVQKIADEYGWQAKINTELGQIKVEDKQQSDESDANFLTRLAKTHDAIATVKKGTLLFLKMGESQTASGEPLPEINILRSEGDQHRYSNCSRDEFTGVKACYTNVKIGRRREVTVGSEDKLDSIRTVFKSEVNARTAAESRLKCLKRGTASFSFHLAKGNPYLSVESPVKVEGFKPEIDKLDWVATKVSHKLDNGGLTATVDCELKELQEGSEGEAEADK